MAMPRNPTFPTLGLTSATQMPIWQMDATAIEYSPGFVFCRPSQIVCSADDSQKKGTPTRLICVSHVQSTMFYWCGLKGKPSLSLDLVRMVAVIDRIEWNTKLCHENVVERSNVMTSHRPVRIMSTVFKVAITPRAAVY
eukprot:m.73197 g.73197  ORF g.73197 m.73197 type:complete len:139 (-) comp16118_c0_seq7:1105-1521(-)